MQKDDSVPSAGTKADSEQKVEDMLSSSNDTKPNVVGSQCHGTLIESVANEYFESGNIYYKLSHPKYPNIKDVNGKEWSHTEIVDLYKRVTVAPLIINLENKIRPQLDEFEKTTGLSVVLSPVLVWGQSYQEGCELIHKSRHLSEDVYSPA